MLNVFKGVSTLTSDVIVLLILFVVFCIYASFLGKSRIISLILAFYPARFFYEHFPYTAKLLVLHGDNLLLLNHILIFLLFLVPIDIAISRFIFAESGFGGGGHYLRIAGFALCAVILVLIFSYSIVSLDSLYNFSPVIDKLFGPNYIFWWAAGPFGVLFFL